MAAQKKPAKPGKATAASAKAPVEEDQVAFLEIACPDGPADPEVAARALRRVPGVKQVEVSLGTGEAMVRFKRGGLVEESLPRAVNATGQFTAALQAKETWTLDLSPGASEAAAEQARSGLMLLSGVTAAVLRPGELEVTAYVPRVSTDMILRIAAASSCPASVRVETVALRVEGAVSEEVLGRLAKVPGIFRVERTGEADGNALKLTREMGRAGLARLNRVLDGTGCSLKAI